MKRDKDDLHLADIWECCDKIEQYLEGIDKEAFFKNSLIQDAVLRNLTVIGDATKKLRDEVKESLSAC